MSGILVYALHYEGAFNKNSLGAVSEGARLAAELGTECHAIVVGEGVSDELASQLGNYGASKVGGDGSQVECGDFKEPPQKAAGEIIEDEDTNETVEKIVAWLDERKLI